jgi:glycosyltransferase involved in cell wall biosynthesis
MELFGGACRMVSAFLAHTPLIYDAEAVFAAREALRPGRSKIGALKTKVRRKIAEEIALANQAKIVLTVNEIEAGMFRQAGHSDVRVLGHNINVAPKASGFTSRRNLLFVGALDENASPNTDSLVWFVNEVMPKLDRLIGTDYVLNVVGRNGASKIRALADTRVRLLGRIEDISSLYDSSRVFIAPTRFAGGIPFKIHEAASMGLPVVATSLLARQLGWTDEIELLTADRPDGFALACQRLYEDPNLWGRLREAALIRVVQDCSPDRFEEIIHGILRDVVRNFPKGRDADEIDFYEKTV